MSVLDRDRATFSSTPPPSPNRVRNYPFNTDILSTQWRTLWHTWYCSPGWLNPAKVWMSMYVPTHRFHNSNKSRHFQAPSYSWFIWPIYWPDFSLLLAPSPLHTLPPFNTRAILLIFIDICAWKVDVTPIWFPNAWVVGIGAATATSSMSPNVISRIAP